MVARVRKIGDLADAILVADMKEPGRLQLGEHLHRRHPEGGQLGAEVIPVIPTRDMNRKAIRTMFLTCLSLGLESVSLVWGDRYTDVRRVQERLRLQVARRGNSGGAGTGRESRRGRHPPVARQHLNSEGRKRLGDRKGPPHVGGRRPPGPATDFGRGADPPEARPPAEEERAREEGPPQHLPVHPSVSLGNAERVRAG